MRRGWGGKRGKAVGGRGSEEGADKMLSPLRVCFTASEAPSPVVRTSLIFSQPPKMSTP